LQSIADASITIIFEFDAQCLCNLAHASAIAGHLVVIVIVIVVIVIVVVVVVVVTTIIVVGVVI